MSRAPAAILAAAVAILLSGVATVAVRGGEGAPDLAPAPAASPTSADVVETLDEQVARVARVVAEVRGLTFVSAPDLAVVSPGDLVAQVVSQLDGYTESDADLDRRTLELLGAIPAGVDLRELLVTALGEQVAGFYDPETGELVVGADDPSRRVGRIEEVTLAHELDHALVDQVHGLPDLDAEETVSDDGLLALQALVEGDATATMQAYTEVGFTAIDQLLLAGEAAALADELASMTTLPYFLQESLVLPYTEGAGFVQALRARGGWEAVDGAYRTPPTSTWEILFPEVYPRTPPAVPIRANPTLPAPWEEARRSSFGAADLLLLLEAPDGDPTAGLSDARAVVRGWRDGELVLSVDGGRSALSVAVSGVDATLCDGVQRWLAARGARPGPPGTEVLHLSSGLFAGIRCDAASVRFGLAGDAATAERSIPAMDD